ncbi:MAG: aminotransferase class V-fold PLP-dependent enzyme [Actinomycetota bacterium]
MAFPIDRVRADTPGVQGVVHFNNAGSALPPEIVVDTVVGHLRREAEIGGYEAKAEAEDRLDAVYASLARLVGGRPEQIAVIENATRAWDMAVYGYPFEPGDRVITGRSEYVSNVVGLLHLRERHGIEIVLVEDDATGQLDLEALDAELERGAVMVAITHVPTSGGLVNPAEAVGALCRHHNTFYVLDACQSAGQVPIDVAAIGCDVLSSTGRKYLRGPRGTGFLWVGDRALERIEPPFIDLHAAEWTSDDSYDIRADARRFENWETYYAGKLGLGAAVDYAMDLGIDATTERLTELGATLRSALDEMAGVAVHDKGEQRGGIVTFSVDGVPAAQVEARLRAVDINTSTATAGHARYDLAARGLDSIVRASVHYYNTEDEVDRFVDVLSGIR